MSKIKLTNFQLNIIAAEVEVFNNNFPNICKYFMDQKIERFMRNNAPLIHQMNDAKKRLAEENIVFKDGAPDMVVIERKIIDVAGAPKEQPKYDFNYKSEVHKAAFEKGNAELQQKQVEVEI